jgi:hypothetical protein
MISFANRAFGRRFLLTVAMAVAAAWGGNVWMAAQATKPQMTVYKSPTCGCCASGLNT